jgi:hypothetical protein
VTAVEAPLARRYLLGQHETRSVLGRREPGEVALLVSAVGAGVAASVLVAGRAVGLVALVVVLGAAVLAVYLPFRGRTAYRWLPIDIRWLRRRRAGELQYRSSAQEAGILLTGEPVAIAEPPGIGRLSWLRASCRGEPLAVVVQPDGALTACPKIEGPGLGLADLVEQETAAARWGTVLRDLANADTLVDRISLIERCVPRDPRSHERYVERFGWVPAPDELVASYDELHGTVGAVSEEHRNYLVVRLRGGRALYRASQSAGGGAAGVSVVAGRECASVVGRLQDNGVRVLRPLSESMLAALIASSYAPWRHIDDWAGTGARDAWPLGLTTHREHVEVDGWCHATAWIKAWPLVPVGVDFLAPLLVQTPGVTRTVAVTFGLQPTDVAMSKVLADLTSDNAHASAAAKAGRTADPRDGRQLSQAEQRAQDVANGAAGVKLVGYLTVTAASPEELDQAKRQLRTAAARSWLSLEWCDKEHDVALVNTLPFARGLR